MATKTFNARIANKRDTSANWTSNNPVLLNGEVIIVDTEAGQVRYKVGNGTSTYTQLPFTDESLITNINGKLSLSGGTMTGNIDMGGHKLTGLGAPVNPNDAVRQTDLKVVSDEVDGIISGTTGITLAPATTTKIGGVIVGDGIEVEADGTISTNPVPAGGTTGQVLTKTSTGEEWSDAPSGLPDGGTEGQMLYKSADGAEWGDKPVMYVNITKSGGTYSADKTAQEIYEAYQNGYAVFAVPWDSDIPILLLSYTYKGNTANEYVANFLASDFLMSYQVLIQDITNFVAFASARRSANDVSFTPTSTLTSDNVQDAIEEVDTQLSTKLTTPTGTAGQLLGFTADNTVGAVDAPESGLTQEQADDRYLQLTGGEVNGEVTVNDWFYVKSGAISVNPSPLMNTAGINSDEIATNKIYRRRSAGYPNLSFSNNNIRLYNNKGNGASVSVGTTGDLNGSQVKISGDYVYISNLVDPTDPDDAANKAYVDSKAPTSVTVTLTTSGWSSNTQTVTVSGVSASETAQLITPTPAIASQTAYYEAGIMCTGQAANSLTFTCQTVPTSNLTVYVVIQPLS